jgi:hypothetical protein
VETQALPAPCDRRYGITICMSHEPMSTAMRCVGSTRRYPRDDPSINSFANRLTPAHLPCLLLLPMWPTSQLRFRVTLVAIGIAMVTMANGADVPDATDVLAPARVNSQIEKEALNSTTAVPERTNSESTSWSPCGFTIDPKPDDLRFECTKLKVPLCYDGVCKSGRQIELFVKRRLAEAAPKDPSVPRKAVIFLAGGPGEASHDCTFCSILSSCDVLVGQYTVQAD